MLLDPFADPLSDLQPCPERAARQATLKKRSLSEIFEATLKSRDHNILMSLLTGMYARLEGARVCCSVLRHGVPSVLRCAEVCRTVRQPWVILVWNSAHA